MSKPSKPSDSSRDAGDQSTIEIVRQRFVADWESALRGQPEPQIEAYLSEVPEPQRRQLRRDLESLDQEYRQRCDLSAETASLPGQPAAGNGDARGGPPGVRVNDSSTNQPRPQGDTADAMAASSDISETVEYSSPFTRDAALQPPETLNPPEAGRWISSPSALGRPDAAQPRRPATPVVVGYEILERLGHGAMGVVYKARQIGLNRLVALKMIRSGDYASDLELARFRKEAEAVAGIQHVNIVQIYEIGEQGGLPYFSLEYVEGGSLAQKAAGTPQSPREAAQLVYLLAQAMDCAHQKGILHRDLKPSNILLTADGQPKISDFGLAKKLGEEAGQTHSGDILGTPSYMSPEQAEGRLQEVGPASDVYALGVILYELLTGRVPFKALTVLDTLEQVRTREPVAPTELLHKLPRDLETICLKCLQKDPKRRYSSAGALAEDLRRFLAHEPILARPVSRAERLWRWCRRNPRLAFMGATTACAIVAWAITMSVLSISLERQKNETDRARQQADHNAVVARDNEHRAIEQEAIARDNAKVASDLHLQAATRMGELGKDVFKILRARALRQHAGPDMRALSAQVRTLFEQMMREMGKDLDSAGGNHFGLAGAYQRVGDLLLQQGQSAEAQRYFQKGYELTRAIARQEPDNDMARANSVVFLLRLGNMEMLLHGDAHAAREYYRKAQALREEIAEHPRSRAYTELENKIGLSYCAWELGRAELELGHPAAARDHMQKAVDYRRAWVEANPQSEEARGRLAEMCMWLGIASWHVEDAPAVEASFGEARRIYAELLAPYPNAIWFRADLANILSFQGEAFLRLGKLDEAERSLAESLREVRVSLAGDPEETSYSETLAGTEDRLARLAEVRGKRDAARPHDQEALQLWGELLEVEPNNLSWQAAHARSLAHCGKEAEAIAKAETLLKKNPRSASLQLETARCYAISAAQTATPQARQRYIPRAIEAVRAATGRGYKDWFALRTDPDLAALRQEPEYQALLKTTPPR